MKKQAGFTLIEVLVAVVVLALGLIGLAALQTTGLANNQSAYNRSQASQLAYDMADRIRSNSDSAPNYVTATANGVIRSCPNGTTNPCTACTTTGTECNSATMVTKDVFEWTNALSATLPSGVGQVSRENPAEDVYTIVISWNDTKVSSGANDNRFVMRFRKGE